MFCPNCGKELPDSSKFCLNCGHELKIQDEIISDKSNSSNNPAVESISGTNTFDNGTDSQGSALTVSHNSTVGLSQVKSNAHGLSNTQYNSTQEYNLTLLEYYVSNGDSTQKKYAKSLKSMNFLGKIAVGFFVVAVLFGFLEAGILVVTSIAMIILFACLSAKQELKAKEYFEAHDPDVFGPKYKANYSMKEGYIPPIRKSTEQNSTSYKLFAKATIIIGIIVLGAWIYLWNTSLSPAAHEKKYNEAYALAENGQYYRALKIFKTIKGYKDADMIIKGINCMSYVSDVKLSMEPSTWLPSLLFDINLEYDPLTYTYFEVITIPSEGVANAMLYFGTELIGDRTENVELALQGEAREIYDKYFANSAYSDISVVVMRYVESTDTWIYGDYKGAR